MTDKPTRHLFDRPCRHCGGSGWEVTQWPGNPPERDGCRHCSGGTVPGLITRGLKQLELLILRLRRFARKQLARLPWRRRQQKARAIAALASPQIPEPVAPRPLSLAVDAARRAFPDPTFRLLFSPALPLWVIVVEHGGRRVQKSISVEVLHRYPPDLIEREAFRLCRQAAYELDPSFARPVGSQELELRRGCPRNVPIPCHETGPMRVWIAEMEDKHRPDGVEGDYPEERGYF